MGEYGFLLDESSTKRQSTGFRFMAWVLSATLLALGVGPGRPYVVLPAMAVDSEEASHADEENLRYFTDLPVVTHEGGEVRFYSDLLKNKRVVISFFYVNCPTAQPTLLTLFKLQKKLGDRLGSDVVLLSISVDPERDDLDAVRGYAGKFNPQKGWYFITGKPENMDIINKRLGNTMRLPEGHLRQFILGDTRTNHWMRLVESVPVMALEDGLKSLDQKE
jgi:protein SCO1